MRDYKVHSFSWLLVGGEGPHCPSFVRRSAVRESRCHDLIHSGLVRARGVIPQPSWTACF